MAKSEAEESVVGNVFQDAFIDEQFSTLDLREDGGLTQELNRIGAEENPVLTADPEPAPEPKPVVEPKPEAEEPRTYTYDDGSSVVIEKSSKGWKATLNSNSGGSAEVFYGGTKDELLVNLSAGKMKATQKIREMNRQRKLEGVAAPVQTPAASGEVLRSLSADDIFDIKTKLADNPDLAFSTWFQKKTGMTLEELVKMTRIGKSASDELAAEGVVREFLGSHPEYVAIDSNFKSLIAWLCKYELGQPLAGRDPSAMIEVLHSAGHFTSEKLNKAYDDLVSDGFLELRSPEPDSDPEPEVVPAQPVAPVSSNTEQAAAAPASTSGRIAREERRPRAGLGIRARETVASTTESPKPPSVEELDSLSDEQVNKLFGDIRKTHIGTRR